MGNKKSSRGAKKDCPIMTHSEIMSAGLVSDSDRTADRLTPNWLRDETKRYNLVPRGAQEKPPRCKKPSVSACDGLAKYPEGL